MPIKEEVAKPKAYECPTCKKQVQVPAEKPTPKC
jgi:hypothetical protein